jgi:hypothetical protein
MSAFEVWFVMGFLSEMMVQLVVRFIRNGWMKMYGN